MEENSVNRFVLKGNYVKDDSDGLCSAQDDLTSSVIVAPQISLGASVVLQISITIDGDCKAGQDN